MSELPEEIWRKIIYLGVNNKKESNRLEVEDICTIATTCKTINQLSNEDSLWDALFESNFGTILRLSKKDPLDISASALFEMHFGALRYCTSTAYTSNKARLVAWSQVRRKHWKEVYSWGVIEKEREILKLIYHGLRRLDEESKNNLAKQEKIAGKLSKLYRMTPPQHVAYHVERSIRTLKEQLEYKKQSAVKIKERYHKMEERIQNQKLSLHKYKESGRRLRLLPKII